MAEEVIEKVYRNDLVMSLIIANVDKFSDRNRIELTSRRMRAIALKSPIRRCSRYQIRIEDENSKKSNNFWRLYNSSDVRLSVRTCSDVPVERKRVLVKYKFRCSLMCQEELRFFMKKVQERIGRQIFELEIGNVLFSTTILDEIESMLNLKRFIFRNNKFRCGDSEDEFLPDPKYVSSRIEALTFQLGSSCTLEIKRVKLLIGSGLKHLCLQVTPQSSKDQWFLEEVMIELELHNVRLETCQLYICSQSVSHGLVASAVQFMFDRSKILTVIVSPEKEPDRKVFESTWYADRLRPSLTVQFKKDNDLVLTQLIPYCHEFLNSLETLKIQNLDHSGIQQLQDVLPLCRQLKELTLIDALKTVPSCRTETMLADLPKSLESLIFDDFKLSATSIDIISNRVSETLKSLKIVGKSSGNSVPNFLRVLQKLKNLQKFEVDLAIPHLIFPKLADHPNLKKFKGKVERTLNEEELKVVQSRFENVHFDSTTRFLTLL